MAALRVTWLRVLVTCSISAGTELNGFFFPVASIDHSLEAFRASKPYPILDWEHGTVEGDRMAQSAH